MTVIVQRLDRASVIADGEQSGRAARGMLLLIGVRAGDSEDICDRMADKIAKMRIFEDENGKMNLSLSDVGGEVLAVSNFTLCGSCRRGNRPDFFGAERPEAANALYLRFVERLRACGIHTETGVFGADMKISAELCGPVTLIVESDRDLAKR